MTTPALTSLSDSFIHSWENCCPILLKILFWLHCLEGQGHILHLFSWSFTFLANFFVTVDNSINCLNFFSFLCRQKDFLFVCLLASQHCVCVRSLIPCIVSLSSHGWKRMRIIMFRPRNCFLLFWSLNVTANHQKVDRYQREQEYNNTWVTTNLAAESFHVLMLSRKKDRFLITFQNQIKLKRRVF